jgi:HK97 family phage prohead protease
VSDLDYRARRQRDLTGTLERRHFPAELELREEGSGFHFRGYATVFSHPYQVGSGSTAFTEMFMPGAFRRDLHNGPDTVLNLEHGRGGSGMPIARTKSGTLSLVEDAHGLRADADLEPSDPDVEMIAPKIKRGDVTEMSIAFRTSDDVWEGDERKIRQASAHRGDVSIVTAGANTATTATLRGDSADLEYRGSYAAHELAELGAKGEAFANPDGHWSYPTRTRSDIEAAIKAIGRGGASHNAIRHYVIGRAAKMGLSHLIPPNWAPSGALRSVLTLDFTRRAAQEIELLRLGRPSASAYQVKTRPADTSTRAKMRARRLTQEAEIATLRARA